MPNAIWIDLNNFVKLDYLQKCCVAYINVPENRELLATYLKSEKPLYDLRNEIDIQFKSYKNAIKKKNDIDYLRTHISDETIEDLFHSVNRNINHGYLTDSGKRY